MYLPAITLLVKFTDPSMSSSTLEYDGLSSGAAFPSLIVSFCSSPIKHNTVWLENTWQVINCFIHLFQKNVLLRNPPHIGVHFTASLLLQSASLVLRSLLLCVMVCLLWQHEVQPCFHNMHMLIRVMKMVVDSSYHFTIPSSRLALYQIGDSH